MYIEEASNSTFPFSFAYAAWYISGMYEFVTVAFSHYLLGIFFVSFCSFSYSSIAEKPPCIHHPGSFDRDEEYFLRDCKLMHTKFWKKWNMGSNFLHSAFQGLNLCIKQRLLIDPNLKARFQFRCIFFSLATKIPSLPLISQLTESLYKII